MLAGARACQRTGRHEIRTALRTPAAAKLGREVGLRPAARGHRAGGTRRPAGLRLCVGERAPLPGGVFALLRAGGLPRRLRAQHRADQAGPCGRALAAALQPSGPRRRAHRHARPHQPRPGGLGHGRKRLAHGDGRLRRADGRQEGDVVRGDRAIRQHADHGALSGLRGAVFLHALPQCAAEALPEAASAALGRLLAHGDDPRRRKGRHRRAHLRLRQPRRGAAVGRGILRHHQVRGMRAHRPCGQRQYRHVHRLLGPSRRGGGQAARGGRLPLFRLFARPLLCVRPAPAGA